MFLFKFLSKISLLLFLLIFIGLPILNPFLVLVFFILSVFIITGKIRKINLYSITVTLISFLAVLSTLSFSFPQIHEGHNYLYFIEKDSAYLKEALPNKVYNLSKERFNLKYPSELQCDQKSYGCWKFFGDIKRPYAFSADGFWQNTDWSRIVNKFNSENVISNRTGFLNANAPSGDTYSNWYSDKFSNDNPIRPEAPYFIKWRLPKSAVSGELCSSGNIAKIDQGGEVNLEFNSSKKCIILDKSILPIDVIGLQFDKDDSFNLSYKLPKYYEFLENLTIIIKIIFSFIFVLAWIKPRFNISLPIFGFSFLSNFIWGENYLYSLHFNLFFDGGGDTLTHWGYGRWITESIKTGNIYEALMGVEQVFYFMPGYRYFRSLEMIIFGESAMLSYFSVIIMPSLLYFIFKSFIPTLHSFLSIILLLLILPSYSDSVAHYPECVGYAFALLGLIFGIKSINKNDSSLNIFLCTLFFAISIFMRPNLLPASIFFITGLMFLLKERSLQKNILICLIGFSPVLLPLVHNIYFGNKFVVLTEAATIKENVLAPPSFWFEALISAIKGEFDNERLKYIINHFARYILGPGGIILLLTIIMFTLLTPILILTGKLKFFFNLILKNINSTLKLIFLYWVGLQIMLIFYHPANRYAVMSALISVLIFIIISIKISIRNHGSLSKKIDYFEEKVLNQSPKNFISFFVQVWPLGKFPFASGTFSSFFFFIFGYYINLNFGGEYTLLIAIFITFLGFWCTKKYIGKNINSDPKEVVIDEASGQLIASAAAGTNIYLHFFSFLLFRFFDISKLGPIKYLENKGGAFGIIFDDVLAGLISAIIILFFNFYIL